MESGLEKLDAEDAIMKGPNERRSEDHEGAPPPGNDAASEGRTGDEERTGVLVGVLFYVIIGVFIVWSSLDIQRFLLDNLWPIGIAVALVVAAVVVGWMRSGASAKRQIGLIVFVAIPVLLALVAGVSLVPTALQVPMLRSVFLLIVCLLPATMYYLFIASRKSGLLQEYYTNLSRLGLFDRQLKGGGPCRPFCRESEMDRRVRVMSYIQKFEAVYGPIPGDLAKQIVLFTDPDTSPNSEGPEFHRYARGGTLGGFFTAETTIPVVLATLLIGLGWLLTLPPWEIVQVQAGAPIIDQLRQVLAPGEITVHFAFLGAYFFAMQMLFRRYVRKDLRANAYMATSLRIILAVIGTWAVIQAASFAFPQLEADSQALLVVGFVIGAFPPVAWQVIRAGFLAVTGAKFLVPSLSSAIPLSELDGLTVWHEARLEEEDIENVPNMATADLVELILHTRVSPDRIVDWVDQAILLTQLGPENNQREDDSEGLAHSSRQHLREHGIRSASGLVAAHEKSRDRGDIDRLESLLPGPGRSRLRGLVDTLFTNPNLHLVLRWRHLPADPVLFGEPRNQVAEKTGA